MRVAVLSDIHANLHALEAVLAAVDRERPDAIWSLGDVVGYGPQPSRCCAMVAAHTEVGLVGNHDLGVIGTVDLIDFSPDAADVARWTAGVLSKDDREYLESLEPTALTDAAALYHGSPRDPVWEYILTEEAAIAAIHLSPRPVTLVGHSHVALALGMNGGLEGGLAPGGTEIELTEEDRWLINPGSVGQPRDGDARAAWLLLDLDRPNATFHRVDYPIERTQAEILDAGLPESLAQRLSDGT